MNWLLGFLFAYTLSFGFYFLVFVVTESKHLYLLEWRYTRLGNGFDGNDWFA